MEVIPFEKPKKETTEKVETKEEIRKTLELSPFFKDLSDRAQADLIDEMYENNYKKEEEKEEKLAA